MGAPFQTLRLNDRFVTGRPPCKEIRPLSQLHRHNACRLACQWFGLFPFRSPLLRESLRFLFLRVLRCFTSPGIASCPYEFRTQSCGITRMGFPHSETLGSKPVCGSPRLFAAYRVLHRLIAPSHPPYALRSLTYEYMVQTV